MMRFTPNEDQAAFLAVLDQMAEDPAAEWKTSPDWARHDWAGGLDALLEANGFFDLMAEESLGPVAAAMLVERLARLPVLVEAAASALLRPLLGVDLPRPLAVIEGDGAGATRLLGQARSVLWLGPGAVQVAVLRPGDVQPVESIFAYPMGRLDPARLDWQPVAVDPERLRDQWRVALACEMAGAMQAGVAAVVAHVIERQQFGRALGSFQAVQHRLASAAVRVDALYWQALRAADSQDPQHAALALGYAQEVAGPVIYDLHQFMGAAGLTLEHPLHRWTYRLRLLRSALGAATGNLALLADRRWGAA